MSVTELKLKPDQQDCCSHAFSPIPMKRTCEERAMRVKLIQGNQTCVDVFLKCCKAAEKMRQKEMQGDVQDGLGRSEMKHFKHIFLYTKEANQSVMINTI